jgi:plastocyanin
VTLLLCALVLSVSCSSDGESGDVSLTRDQAFDPATLTVTSGDTITFVNDSDETHTVTAYERRIPEGAQYFASGGLSSEKQARADLEEGLISPGETYEVTLDEPGTYAYFCIPHEEAGMTGEIVVER